MLLPGCVVDGVGTVGGDQGLPIGGVGQFTGQESAELFNGLPVAFGQRGDRQAGAAADRLHSVTTASTTARCGCSSQPICSAIHA